MGPKVTLLLAKTRGGFLNCHLFKNGGRGTKPTYIFLVIIPLLVIELKATPNGNPSDDFYWRQKSSSLNVVQLHNIDSMSNEHEHEHEHEHENEHEHEQRA